MQIEEFLISSKDKVKINSSEINSGDVFIALQGKNNHGNKYIGEALKNGASYVITDKRTSIIDNKIHVVDNILSFLEIISRKKRNIYLGEVVGITGSVGKTTLKENLKYFLSSLCVVSVSIKSYNNYLGVIISLLNIDIESKFSIFEIGTNNFFEIKKLASIIMPSQTIITNIFPTHLENFINTRNIAIAKSDIFNPKNNKNINLVILPNNNIDENFLIELANKKKIKDIITFGTNKDSSLLICNVKKIDSLYYNLSLKYKNKINNITLNQSQLHKINNILICYIFFIYNNLNIDKFNSLTKSIPDIEGRGLINKIDINNKKINLIDESYNASPHNMKICIDYFNDINLKINQKKYLILGDMKELGVNQLIYHVEILKQISNRKINNVIICGELFELALKRIKNKKIIAMKNIESILDFFKLNLSDEDYLLVKGSNSSITNYLCKKLLEGNNV